MTHRGWFVAAMTLLGLVPDTLTAQSLGTFPWQVQPFCNVISLSIVQQGGQYLLDGTDDQCGASQKAGVTGVAFLNPDGTIGFSLNIVTAPGGTPVHVDATITLASLGGTWRDSAGRSGVFAFGPGAPGLPPRPATGVGATAIDAAQVQRRIVGTCPAGQSMSAVAQDGTVSCQAVAGTAGGDITSVAAGSGLSGGGTTGDVALNVAFAGPGASASVARSDHRHEVGPAGVAVGAGALTAQTSGNRNTAVGSLALGAETTGVANTAVGNAALANHATGNGNVAIGDSALASVTSGNFSVAVGYGALAANTSGTANTALGTSALNTNTTGTDNTASGYDALLNNSSGSRNTAVGSAALRAEATGVANTAIGYRAMPNHTTGNGNVAIGDSALAAMASGNFMVAVGYGALAANTTGEENTALGTSALNLNTTGISNTAVGALSLSGNVLGSMNVAVGKSALEIHTNGTNNVAMGTNALRSIVLGADNVAIGTYAGANLTSGSRNIYVGYFASGTNESFTLRLGATNLINRAFVAGIRAITTGVNDAVPVMIDSNGQLGTVSSSRRTKNHIQDLGTVSRAIFDLRPVSFTYTRPFADGSTPTQYGLIAEEVADVLPELVARGSDGEIETVKYHVLPTLLLAEVQRLERARATQAAEIAALRDLLVALQRDLTNKQR